MTDTVSLAEITRAQEVVADVARDTQVIESRYLSRTTGGTIALKAENLQRTGSFKLRGALNKIASLDPSVKGVVTGSAGNHGQSLAYAARARGLTATIFMPERAALAKIAAARESGAEIRLTGDLVDDCVSEARAYAEAEGLAFVHPFDDPAVIAGQGTIGLELLEEVPDLSRVLVPVGGGGLIAGIATALKESRDDIEVIGVQSQCPLADGIAIKHPGAITGSVDRAAGRRAGDRRRGLDRGGDHAPARAHQAGGRGRRSGRRRGAPPAARRAGRARGPRW